jgi:signal transduction histidine kinase
MYRSLVEEMVTDPTVLEHLQKIEQVTDLIQKQIRFTRDYQNIGASSPQWQKIDDTAKNAISDHGDLNRITIDMALDGLEIFADMLLEKVFYNLFDNSLRHGENVTEIRLSFQETPEGIFIYYKDNGVGVPTNVKERIFKREYYRNTGYGLFLAGEILSITGLTIKETGKPGNGVQFEIFAPQGSFRFSAPENHH